MDALLRVLLTNAAAAGLLAVVAFAVSRVVRRPALAHALWLLTLLKLVTPPVVPLPLLPAWRSLPTLTAAAAPTVVRIDAGPRLVPREAAPPVTSRNAAAFAQPPGASRTTTPSTGRVTEPGTLASLARPAIAAALAGGALAVLLLGAIRFTRFRRLLALAVPAPDALLEQATALATALGLRRLPPLRVVPAAIPPMLWPEPTGPVLLLPRELLRELSPAECSALLAHELAHVHRGDHWVRLLELAATALFWWYPVTWWARRALRRAEERCCDEWVLRVLPQSAEAYASGLLKSLTFVSAAAAPVPALASGASPLYELETRLKEILMSRPAPRLAAPLRVALLAAAGLGLAVFPIDARNDEPAPAAKPATPTPARPATPRAAAATPGPARPATTPRPVPVPAPAEPAARAQAATPAAARPVRSDDAARALEAEQRAFDQKRRELQKLSLELQRQELELNARAEQDELRACSEKLRAEGKASEAESCERRGELVGKRAEIQRHRLELEAQRVELDAKQMAEQRAFHEQMERAGEDERKVKMAAMQAFEADQRRIQEETMREQQALEGELKAAEKQARRLESESRVHSVGRAAEEFAHALAAQIEAWKTELQRNPEARPELEREIKRLDAALKALEAHRPEPAKPRSESKPQP